MTAAGPAIPARLWIIAAATGAGAFMAMLDSTVVNLALAQIQDDLGAPLVTLQWVATAYLIAFAVSLPVSGWTGRRFGARPVWLVSTGVFLAASVACALAPTVASLIVARSLQGLAAGLMLPVGQAILGQCAERRQLGRLFGTVGFAVALGPALGPVVGGALIETASWRWLFWINVPVGCAALAAAYLVLPRQDITHVAPLDLTGLLLAGGGTSLLLYGAAEGARLPAAIGAVLSLWFVHRALRLTAPLVDLRLLTRRSYATAVGVCTSTSAAMYGGLLLLPLYLQAQMGLSPIRTGSLLLAIGLGSALALPVAGHLTDRHGPARVCLAGGLLLTFSTASLVSLGSVSFLVIAVLLFARGVGLALAQMPATTQAYGSVTEGEMMDAATLLNMAQRIGGALGAIAVTLAFGEHQAFVPAILVLTLMSLPAMLLRVGPPADAR